MTTLGRLTRGALHEIANPLLALLGTAEFALADAEAGTKLHTRIQLVRETGSEIAEIVKVLQAFARSASEPQRRLSLAEAAETTIALVDKVSTVRDVELSLRLDAEPSVEAAPGDVQRRLVDLLLDGLAEAARGDVVELVVSEQDGWAVVSAGGREVRLEAV
jgi:two-component system, OmpR family, sensor histidine kinase TctE